VICSVAVLATNLIINFILSPYIVKHIGVEANGFVTLANNFVAYAQLIVTSLNSMAARFITIEYVKKDYKKANIYYNSVFWGNLIIVAVLIIPAAILIAKLENFVDVPSNILTDVKLLFSFVFFNFFLTTGVPNWQGAYIANRLDRTYIPQMATSIFNCLGLFTLFIFLAPHVWYVGFTSSVVTIILAIVSWYNTYKLTPELKVQINPKKMICSWKAIKELVGSGIWNSISSVGNMLLSGLDLLICNIVLGATEMGIISLSKTLPNFMQQLSASIRGAFAPELTINYAKGDKEAIFKDLNRAMKLTSVVMTIPIAGIVVLGDRFFALWVPSQDAKLLQVLSILAILGYMFTSGTQILYNVFSTVNKVKQNSIAMLISGVVSTGIVLSLVKFTDCGIYAVAGVSTFVNLCRNMIYTVPATAKYLGFKWYKFFPQVITTVVSSLLLIGIGALIKPLLPQGSWLMFFVSAAIIGLIGLVINLGIVLNKNERNYLFNIIKRKIKY
ncbi:MAG: lipopolysaccharide biosynthesis protein, partial [Eubacterium sp.]|nr:lipopolysaccharide biosynthesis protein [Eubacterium sp.]